MNKSIVLGQYPEYNGLIVKLVPGYELYRQSRLSNDNQVCSEEEWSKEYKDSTILGMFVQAENIVYINNNITNKNKFFETLRHELTHAYIDYYIADGRNWDEEQVCEFMSKHFTSYYRMIVKIQESIKNNIHFTLLFS